MLIATTSSASLCFVAIFILESMRRFALHRNFLMSVTDYAKKNTKAKIYGIEKIYGCTAANIK
jgi:hypothetical protein